MNIKKHFKLFFYLFLLAIVYNAFLIPIHLVAGGTGGLGIFFNKVFGIEPYIVIFVISSFMFLLSAIFLETKDSFSTLLIIVCYPLLIKIVSLFGFDKLFFGENVLTIVFLSAIVIGYLQGKILKMGFNIGGLSVLAQIISKYIKFSITFLNMIINAIIVIIGSIILGIDNLLYAAAFLILCRFVSERVILGASNNKSFKIISKEYCKIESFIENELIHDVTLYDTYGSFLKRDSKLIMSVIPNKDFLLLKNYVKSIDDKAFIFVSDTYEVNSQDKKIINKVLSDK